jgi:hypothetical protein
MGSAEALQQLSMQMQAGAHPGAKIIKDAMGTLSRITDPKARAVGVQAFHGAMAEVQKRHHRQAAEQAIQKAATNGVGDPEQLKMRLDSGEDPQTITQELGKAEHEQAVQQMAADKAAEALGHAEELVKHAPPGRNKLLAQYKLTRYKNSPHDQAQPGSDAKMLEDVQEALLGSAADAKAQAKAHKEHLQETLGPGSRAPGLGGMTTGERSSQLERKPTGPVGFGAFGDTFGSGGPDIPPLQGVGTHATTKAGQRSPAATRPAASGSDSRGGPKRTAGPSTQLPKDKILAAKSEEDLVQVLQESGVPLTHANLSAAANLWRPAQ